MKINTHTYTYTYMWEVEREKGRKYTLTCSDTPHILGMIRAEPRPEPIVVKLIMGLQCICRKPFTWVIFLQSGVFIGTKLEFELRLRHRYSEVGHGCLNFLDKCPLLFKY